MEADRPEGQVQLSLCERWDPEPPDFSVLGFLPATASRRPSAHGPSFVGGAERIAGLPSLSEAGLRVCGNDGGEGGDTVKNKVFAKWGAGRNPLQDLGMRRRRELEIWKPTEAILRAKR